MASVDPFIAEQVLAHQVDLLRLEASVRARVLRLIGQLQRELSVRLTSADLTAFSRVRLESFLRQVNETIADYYVRMQGEAELAMRGAAEVQARHTARLLQVSTGANLPTETFLARLVSLVLIHGAPSAAWWGRQSADTAFRFANAVRHGVATGEANEQIVARVAGQPRKGVPGLMEVSRHNARSLVHASVQTATNASRMETFRKNPGVVKGVRQLSTLDSHTTEICIAYDGGEWDLEGRPLGGTKLPFVSDGGSADGTPRHWGCRSVMVPITKTYRELGLDIPEVAPGQRAAAGGPVSVKTTFEQWLGRRTREQQDEQLGPGRAQLWREGKITLHQLLDLHGNPLTLAQLRERYAA